MLGYPDRVKVAMAPEPLAARPMLGSPTTHKVRIWAPFSLGALLAVLAIAWANIALPIHVRASSPSGQRQSTPRTSADEQFDPNCNSKSFAAHSALSDLAGAQSLSSRRLLPDHAHGSSRR